MLINNIIRTTLCLSVAVSADRWSRQITNTGPANDGTGDWVPVAQQSDRSSNARVLNYQPDQYGQNGYSLPTVESQLQSGFSVGQPFQPKGFKAQSKAQPKAFHQNREPPQQPPTSQSFFKFEMPFFGTDGLRQEALPTVQADYQIQHTAPQQALITSPLFSHKPVFPPEYHPNYHQPQYQPFTHQRPIQQNYVQDIQQQIKEKHVEQKPVTGVQESQAAATYGNQNIFGAPKPSSFQDHQPYNTQPQIPPSIGQEEVQLLYVPYDTLYQQRPEQFSYDTNRFNVVPQPVNPVHINNFYTPEPLTNPDPNLYTTSTTSTAAPSTHVPITTPRSFLTPQFTSQKPNARPKAHQPPLAMFMQKSINKPSSAIDVVNALASAKSIAVLDSPAKSAPPIFVGPAGLPSPNGYTKFELPYLSTINRNNIEYLREVPFFVAPLSYRAPLEFNKIVLPEPHVGSIVVNKPLQSAYDGQVIQEQQQPIRPPQKPARPMYVTPNIDNSGRYPSSTPTLRTTTRPSKHRYQFGTAYDVSAGQNQYKQDIGPGSSLTSIQTQTKDRPNQNEYYQQGYVQEINPSTTQRPAGQNQYNQDIGLGSSPASIQTQTKDRPNQNEYYQQGYVQEINPSTTHRPVLNEYFKEQYNHVPPQVTSVRPLIDTKDQEVHPVTSLRPTTIRAKNQYEHFNEQYNPELVSSTSIKPEQDTYLKEQYLQEVHPSTSLKPTITQPHSEQNEYSNNQYEQKLNVDGSGKPTLIHSQREPNNYYKDQYNYRTISSTSPKTTHTKERQGQHKHNRVQYGQEVQPDISNAAGYTKDQLEQIQYLTGNYRQDVRPSTSRPSPTRTKSSDRVRHNHHRKPIEITTQSTYGQFKPMPNKVVNEEYFKVQPIKTSSSSTTTTTTAAPVTTSTTEATIQQQPSEVPIQSNFADTYSSQISPSNEQIQQTYNVQPSYYTSRDAEEYRMKTYFRQQDAFKNRPTAQSSTTPPPTFENVQYTPISLDYDSQLYNIPSSTPTYYDESGLRKTKPKERVTFYAPTPQAEEQQPVVEQTPFSTDPVEYSHGGDSESNTEPVTETTTKQSTTSSYSYHSSTEKRRPSHRYNIPSNHRPSYNNEVVYNHDDKVEHEQEVEYEPNPYQLPSELPPLTPNLPGLVNGLIEKDKENAIEKGTTEMEPPTTTTTTLRPTRRPINRTRRPNVTRVASSVSYSSSSDITTRRPLNRVRRPYNQRNNNNQSSAASTTRSSTPRNPNRVRYNPTPEERRQYRPRTRIHSKKVNGEEDNLEYQRDVLKQNYPVFKPATKSTTSTTTTTTTTTEPATEAQEIIVTITPNTKKEQFSGLLEPLQIAQDYHRQDNYGPGYFPNQEDFSPTEALIEKNEIQEVHPIYTTTTEPPKETTRKSLFIRRGSRPTRTTTEAPPATTYINEERHTEKTTERYTVRPRVRPSASERPKVVKIRGRIRKPHPASTTTIAPAERKLSESGYQKLNQFNQDFYEEEYRNEANQQSQDQIDGYNLEPQESKWSPSLSNTNGFKPVNLQGRSKILRKSETFEDEPDIVTANPELAEGRRDTFSFNVSAGFGPSPYGSVVKTDSDKDNKNTSETSFSDLLEEVMSGVETMYKDKNNEEKSESGAAAKQKQARRKGAWKRVRVSQSDALETAESQNIGTQIYNSIFSTSIGQEYGTRMQARKANDDTTTLKNVVDTTVESISPTTMETRRADFETDSTFVEESSLYEDVTKQPETNSTKTETNSPKIEESANESFTTMDQSIDKGPDVFTDSPEYDTGNMDAVTDTITRRSDMDDSDDLETQPSLFDEVKKQLSSLFSADDNDDEEDPVKPSFHPRKQEYTSIQRVRAVSENNENKIKDTEKTPDPVTMSPFHKNLMESVVYATSTSTEVSHETEICYRGRCIKTAKQL